MMNKILIDEATVKLARECGINFHQAGWPELERLVELARADEREACAQIAEAYREWDDTGMGIAAAIRARSNT